MKKRSPPILHQTKTGSYENFMVTRKETKMTNDFNEMLEMMNLVKGLQMPGEPILGTFRRVVMAYKESQTNVTSQTQQQTQENISTNSSTKPTVYKFKTQPEMHKSMIKSWPANWAQTIGPALQGLYGLTPTEPDVQKEMARIYTSMNDETFGKIMRNGQMTLVAKPMIEPTS